MNAFAIVNPGHVMPEAYRKEFIEFCPKGGAMCTDATGVLEQDQLKAAEMNSAIQAADKNLKDKFRCYFATDARLTGNNTQPFMILKGEGKKALLYALVDGPFEKYDTEDAEGAPETEFIEGWLIDNVRKAFSGCGGDLKKLFQLLDTQKFRNELQAEMGSKGIIALFAAGQDPLWISKGYSDESAKFTWGMVSNKLTYEEPKAKEPDKPAVMTKALFEKMKYKEQMAYLKANPAYDPDAPDVPAATPDKKDSKPSVPSVVPDGVELEKATDQGAIGVKGGKRFLFPPSNLNDEELKKFYPKHAGDGALKHYNWKDRVGIPIEKLVKSSHFFAMVHGPASKDTDAHGQITKGVPMLTGPEIGEAFNVINKATPFESYEALLASVDSDPKSDNPSFSARLGQNLEQWQAFFKMSRADTLKLSHKVLEAAFHELRVRFVKDHPEIWGNTTVVKKDDAPAAPVDDKPKPLTKEEFGKLKYKQQMAYLKEHPELEDILAA